MAKFKKGQSGNPKGRPKGTTSIANLIKKIGAENISAKSEHDKLEFIMEAHNGLSAKIVEEAGF